MISFPNAKINIGLHVTEKRADNYHNLETVFYPVALRDALEVVVSEEEDLQYSSSGIAVNTPPENNLIVKAYRLLQKDFPLPSVAVHLHKQIPFGAGLGGGSADAAFMLKMLNEMFSLNIPVEKLEEYAAVLGADCAFFVRNEPVLATGIGNVFQDIDLNLEKYHIAIVKPPVFVSTAQAYAGVTPKMPENSLAEMIKKPVSEWKNCVFNDFEQGVFEKFPVIAEVKNELYRQGAVYASMSGSGSAVYGIFEKKPKLEDVFPSDYFVF